MPIPVGLNVWSRLVESLFPYLDKTVGPFEPLWFPDHVQYGANKVAEGWTLLAFALARHPDKLLARKIREPTAGTLTPTLSLTRERGPAMPPSPSPGGERAG